VRQIRDDGLATVARIAPDQVVEHAPLGAEIIDGPGLMDVEMRRSHRNAIAQYAAGLGVGLGRPELKTRAVEFIGYFGGQREPRWQSIGSRDHGGATLENFAAAPPWTSEARVAHLFPPSLQTTFRHPPREDIGSGGLVNQLAIRAFCPW